MIKIISDNVDSLLSYLEYKYPTNEDCYFHFIEEEIEDSECFSFFVSNTNTIYIKNTKNENNLLLEIIKEYYHFYCKCIDEEYNDELASEFTENCIKEFLEN